MHTSLSMRFLGVGNSHAAELGCSSAVLEAAGEPLLLIDCGPDTLPAYRSAYGEGLPPALFITHNHLDHIGGLEGLFYRLMTGQPRAHRPRLYVPVDILPVLQRRMADYPNILAEGGANFWDAFQLIPVSGGFWHRDLLFSVFPARHHAHGTAFGLALPGHFLYTGDTRPIPEVINRFAARGERIFHDCALGPGPSHTALEDIRREYKPEQWRRMIFYHYESAAAAAAIKQAGLFPAQAGEAYALGKQAKEEAMPDGEALELPRPVTVGSMEIN